MSCMGELHSIALQQCRQTLLMVAWQVEVAHLRRQGTQ